MPLFRKKPVVIEARRYDGSDDSAREVVEWALSYKANAYQSDFDAAYIRIATREGEMLGSPGDWIIRGVKDEFYPCKPDIFDATYEPADAVDDSQSKIDGLTLRCADLDAKLAEAHAAMMAAQERARDAELKADELESKLSWAYDTIATHERVVKGQAAAIGELRDRLDEYTTESSDSLIDRARGKIRRWQDAIAAAKRALKG